MAAAVRGKVGSELVKWDRNLKPKLANALPSQTDRRTDGLASWHKQARDVYITSHAKNCKNHKKVILLSITLTFR